MWRTHASVARPQHLTFSVSFLSSDFELQPMHQLVREGGREGGEGRREEGGREKGNT